MQSEHMHKKLYLLSLSFIRSQTDEERRKKYGKYWAYPKPYHFIIKPDLYDQLKKQDKNYILYLESAKGIGQYAIVNKMRIATLKERLTHSVLNSDSLNIIFAKDNPEVYRAFPQFKYAIHWRKYHEDLSDFIKAQKKKKYGEKVHRSTTHSENNSKKRKRLSSALKNKKIKIVIK